MAQKMKTENVLNNEIALASESCHASLIFMKRLTGVLISQIAYQRNLFNEDDFDDRRLAGIAIKVVKEGGSSPNATMLSKWVMGVFDALERKYLKSFTLEICDSKHLPVESYLFEYSYLNDEIQCSISSTQGSKLLNQQKLEKDLKETVKSTLRNIVTLSNSQDRLPSASRHEALLKIAYQPGVPLDYEPPGFKPYLVDDSLIPTGSVSKFNCGKVKTSFHSVTVKLKFFEAEKEEVACLCGKTDNHSNLLKCIKCGNIQHAACFKIFTEDEVSQKEHTCFKCLDKDLTADFSTEECIFRRTVVVCSRSKSMSMQKIMQLFRLDSEQAEVCMRRLLREEALKKSTQPLSSEKLDFLYNVNKLKVHELVKKIFDL